MTAKPLYGQPCNSCGDCCRHSRCPLAAEVFGPGVDCPALEADDTCGLVKRPKHYTTIDKSERRLRESALLLIGSGFGCDWRADEPLTDDGWAFRQRLLAACGQLRSRATRSLRLWRK